MQQTQDAKHMIHQHVAVLFSDGTFADYRQTPRLMCEYPGSIARTPYIRFVTALCQRVPCPPRKQAAISPVRAEVLLRLLNERQYNGPSSGGEAAGACGRAAGHRSALGLGERGREAHLGAVGTLRRLDVIRMRSEPGEEEIEMGSTPKVCNLQRLFFWVCFVCVFALPFSLLLFTRGARAYRLISIHQSSSLLQRPHYR